MMKSPLKHALSNTIFWGVITGALYEAFYKKFDLSVFYWMQHHASPFYKKLAFDLSYVFSATHWTLLGIVCLVLFLFLNRKFKSPSSNLAFVGSALIFAAIISTVIKFILARYRPEMLLEKNLYGFHFFSLHHAYNSTPSGHTTMSFAGLFALSRIIQKSWATWLLLLLAVLIGFSRIILSAHYTSDVFLGIYIGVICVYWTQMIKSLSPQTSQKLKLKLKLETESASNEKT